MTHLRRRTLFAVGAVGVLTLVALTVRPDTRADIEANGTGRPTEQDPITIQADLSQEWVEDSAEVALLRGHCRLVQGDAVLEASRLVLWRTRQGTRERVSVYLEGDVTLERPGQTVREQSLLIDLVTKSGVRLDVRARNPHQDGSHDAFFQRAVDRRASTVRGRLQQTNFAVQPEAEQSGPLLPSVQVQPESRARRRVRISPRSRLPYEIMSERSDRTTPPEQIWVLRGGINMIITGDPQYGTVDLTADRVVIWTEADADSGEFSPNLDQSLEDQLQVYLEGNIVARQGQNVLRAERMFYDAREDRALLLNAELKYFVEQLDGNIRVRAKRIRQLSRKEFHARDAWASPSKFGKPGIRVDASDIFLEERLTQPWFGPNAGRYDPVTGAPYVEETPWVTSLNNRFLVEDFPIFYSPYLSAPAEIPDIPIRRVTVRSDDIFGEQLKTVWDGFSLFGIDRPQGTDWTILLDGYTKRGLGAGTQGEYQGADVLGLPGRFQGDGLAYFIHDIGEDDLGIDRNSLDIPDNNRFRFQWHHRQQLPYHMTLAAEIGYLTDRNFLEQYWESEFDNEKDNETLVHLKQTYDNWSWTGLAQGRLNDFENVTEWYPRLDGYVLGEPVFGSPFIWSTHSYAGYGRLRPADAPGDPNDVFSPLPYVAPVGGAVAMTRHQIDAPFNLGALKVSPYALGEASYWQEDLTGDDLDRLYGQLGVRSSLMIWKVMPYVRSRLLNVNGLAHKVNFEVDYLFADSTADFNDIPQYNDIDDNAQERLRQRALTNTFGGMLPLTAEPRFYAVRHQAGANVTSPAHELVDDFHVVNFAVRQRLQTKVGPPDRLRIIDWMTLDVGASFFPQAERDNFDEPLGILRGDYRWNVGSRTSVFAQSVSDFFDGGQHSWNVGVNSRRTKRGSLTLGYRQVQGQGINSQFVSVRASYKMNPKWIASAMTSYDIGESRNVGQTFMISRIGKDFIFHVGGTVDSGKDNTGIAVALEPLFLPLGSRYSNMDTLLGGAQQ